MKIVGFLQNAWSPLYAGGEWPRTSWLKALHVCRTGQRLRKNFTNYDEIWWDNTTPIVGDNPNSVVKPDYQHIEEVIKSKKPILVVTFGVQAEQAVYQIWNKRYDLLHLPHPACRVVNNKLYGMADKIIQRYDFDMFNPYVPSRLKLSMNKDGSVQITEHRLD